MRPRLRGGVSGARTGDGGGGGRSPGDGRPSLSYPGRKGGHTPQPASQKVPRTPGQVPERQGRRLESHYWFLSIIIALRGRATGGGVGGGGVCGRERAREGMRRKAWVWDLCFPCLFFFFGGWLLFWGREPGGVVCMNFLHVLCMHACMQVRPPEETSDLRPEVTGRF